MYSTKKTMAPTTMKCRLPNVHELFLCIGFSFSGCYSSQQLTQNNILLTTIKFKTFQDYFIKFKDVKALNLVQSNSRLFKTFKALYGPCNRDYHGKETEKRSVF